MKIAFDRTSFFATAKIFPILALVARRYVEYQQTGILAIDEIDVGLIMGWLGLSNQQGIASMTGTDEKKRRRNIAKAERLEQKARELRRESEAEQSASQ